jgi:hypothetical protein
MIVPLDLKVMEIGAGRLLPPCTADQRTVTRKKSVLSFRLLSGFAPFIAGVGTKDPVPLDSISDSAVLGGQEVFAIFRNEVMSAKATPPWLLARGTLLTRQPRCFMLDSEFFGKMRELLKDY